MAGPGGAVVQGVAPGGVGDRLGIKPGDRVLAVNGRTVEDLIDLLWLSAGPRVQIEYDSSTGEHRQASAAIRDNEGLGLFFEDAVFDGIRRCRNRCVFCFVDQMPPEMRSTLYIKDDDYRLSFLQGAYVTLTNMAEPDWERILRMRLSPLYVSVHATDPAVRGRLLGLPHEAPVLPALKRLISGGTQLHAQVVACPGINDGEVLNRTISDLAALYPGVASLAVVPVGLTRHRDRLFAISPYDCLEASAVIDQIDAFQRKYLKELGTRFVFAADEWFLKAGRSLPEDEEYEDYPQISNGVGLLRLFVCEFEAGQDDLPVELGSPKNLLIVTGRSASGVISQAVQRLNAIDGVNARVIVVDNRFFGQSVTVTGLLTGQDVLNALRAAGAGRSDVVLVPDVALRSGEQRFLDDVTLEDLARATGADVRPVHASAHGLIEAVLDLRDGVA